jgi:hypothetical protein
MRYKITSQDAKPNFGTLTEAQKSICEATISDCWSEPMTADEILAEMDLWDAE